MTRRRAVHSLAASSSPVSFERESEVDMDDAESLKWATYEVALRERQTALRERAKEGGGVELTPDVRTELSRVAQDLADAGVCPLVLLIQAMHGMQAFANLLEASGKKAQTPEESLEQTLKVLRSWKKGPDPIFAPGLWKVLHEDRHAVRRAEPLTGRGEPFDPTTELPRVREALAYMNEVRPDARLRRLAEAIALGPHPRADRSKKTAGDLHADAWLMKAWKWAECALVQASEHAAKSELAWREQEDLPIGAAGAFSSGRDEEALRRAGVPEALLGAFQELLRTHRSSSESLSLRALTWALDLQREGPEAAARSDRHHTIEEAESAVKRFQKRESRRERRGGGNRRDK